MSVGDARTRGIQRGQWVLFSAVTGLALLLFAIWMGAGGGNNPPPLRGIDAELTSVGEAEAGWVRQSETRLGGIETRLREIESANRQLEQENLRLQGQLGDQIDEARQVIDLYAAEIEDLSGGIGTGVPAPVVGDPFAPPTFSRPGVAPVSNAASGREIVEGLAAPLVQEFELEGTATSGGAVDAIESIPIARPTADYVSAGSYAEAVVLAGADASAGVQSQGDPRPVLLRLTSPAYGAAADGVAETSGVEGCTVTAAAYGDLSSEKVYVRLQTMACVGDAPGTVIETAVAGFVAGGGKAGVRGPVVSREGALVQKAFLSGVFSGFGQSVSQAFGPQAVLAGGGAATIGNQDLGDMGRAGLGAGVGTAGQEVSDYLIRRAEQYQPVIQLAAGTPVTVVFLEGAWLDGRAAGSPAGGNSAGGNPAGGNRENAG